MTKLSQGLLHTCANGDCTCGAILDHQSDYIATAHNPDNQRRLVACWNACHGLSTEDLETKGLAMAFGNQLLELERQRDELLAALESLNYAASADSRNAKIVRAAIAKAKEAS
ncbi:hypothetical protein PU634_04925 [Oceanimonas pelagia]|uniref:Uncharacterized protein n=1 Tax=Oceanimonas pelagia TaxID=3028314 RepID=A0AA50Q8E7_9GAMM|nr:hypothetical protein [Oceanimonas pelagia]WMC11710.1 hypothetical protein PU634_04925 [Oceanimonas pelagia]